MSPSSARPSASSSHLGLPNELWEMVVEYVSLATCMNIVCRLS